MSSIESIIDRQIRRWELEKSVISTEKSEIEQRQNPVLTVSRQRGSRGSFIAHKLAERFNYDLLHRDIIERVCASSGYKQRVVQSLDEQSKSRLQTWFEGMIEGSYVDQSDYSRHLHEVIYSIAELGGVVVVGRGANLIIGLDRGFHVRVIAPRDQRIKNLVTFEKLSLEEATREVDNSDKERTNFIKEAFGKSVDAPLNYDLILNSAWITPESAVNSIAMAAMEKFETLRHK